MKFKSPIPSFVSPTIQVILLKFNCLGLFCRGMFRSTSTIEASFLLKDIDDNLIEIERLKRRISKYKKDDEDRRQGRKD